MSRDGKEEKKKKKSCKGRLEAGMAPFFFFLIATVICVHVCLRFCFLNTTQYSRKCPRRKKKKNSEALFPLSFFFSFFFLLFVFNRLHESKEARCIYRCLYKMRGVFENHQKKKVPKKKIVEVKKETSRQRDSAVVEKHRPIESPSFSVSFFFL